jgi:hypothetical protein
VRMLSDMQPFVVCHGSHLCCYSASRPPARHRPATCAWWCAQAQVEASRLALREQHLQSEEYKRCLGAGTAKLAVVRGKLDQQLQLVVRSHCCWRPMPVWLQQGSSCIHASFIQSASVIVQHAVMAEGASMADARAKTALALTLLYSEVMYHAACMTGWRMLLQCSCSTSGSQHYRTQTGLVCLHAGYQC